MINTKQFRLLVWLVIILLALNVSAVATILWMRFSAQKPGPEKTEFILKTKKRHFRLHDEMIKNEVGLNDRQIEAFRQLRDKHFSEIRDITTDIDKTRELQFISIRDKNADPEFIDSLSKRTGELHYQWSVSSSIFLNDVKDLCTPEQKEKLFNLLEKSRMKHGYKSGRIKCRDKAPSEMPCEGSGHGNRKQ